MRAALLGLALVACGEQINTSVEPADAGPSGRSDATTGSSGSTGVGCLNIIEKFESGWAPETDGWTATPTFELDTARPINGEGSAMCSTSQVASMKHSLVASCGLELTFSFKSDVFASAVPVPIVRIAGTTNVLLGLANGLLYVGNTETEMTGIRTAGALTPHTVHLVLPPTGDGKIQFDSTDVVSTQTYTLSNIAPVSIEIGVLAASDAGAAPTSVWFDDVAIK